MKILSQDKLESEAKIDVLALLVFEEDISSGALPGSWKEFFPADELAGDILKLFAGEQFKGKKNQAVQFPLFNRGAIGRLLILGLGKTAEFSTSDLRAVGAKLSKVGQQTQAAQLALVTPEIPTAVPAAEREAFRWARFLAEGAALGLYKFDKYLTGDKKKPNTVETIRVIAAKGTQADSTRGVELGTRVAERVAFARDLVNEPAGYLTPIKMSEIAKEIATKHGLEIRVFDRAECSKRKMGMYLGVAQGADNEPRFIHLTYKPKGTPKKKIALIGKGVTFDSGGLSLKPSNAMEDMKIDMAGSAAVISAIAALADLQVPHEVHAICACTENMLSARSYKLGDVLVSMNGKTVEINNTDAEGRLTLGDAITYAITECAPDEIFDFATLTGACMVALGPNIAGVMTNNTALSDRWLAAAKSAGEEMWPLPLPEKLRDQLKSEIADMRNTGDRLGGALTAGLFLKEFVGETPWVHVDLAGPASADKESGAIAKGGTGFAVATMVEYVTSQK